MDIVLTMIGNGISHLFALAVEWISFIGSGGLILLGIGLILYSAVATGLIRLFAVPGGITAIVTGVYLAFVTYGASERVAGHAAGVAEERARWEEQDRIEKAHQATVKSAVELLGDRLVGEIQAQLASIPQATKDAIDAAKGEDIKLVPKGCDDVFRGLPPGVLLKLDPIGRVPAKPRQYPH
jgi:ABC-type anion transport system duplicated permease subunit